MKKLGRLATPFVTLVFGLCGLGYSAHAETPPERLVKLCKNYCWARVLGGIEKCQANYLSDIENCKKLKREERSQCEYDAFLMKITCQDAVSSAFNICQRTCVTEPCRAIPSNHRECRQAASD
jgi:hypothetical protein